MATIAAASGVSKPVLYDHFPSKRALFAAVLESVRLELLESGKSATSAHLDAESRMRAGITAFFDFVQSRPSAARVMFVIPHQEVEAADAAGDFQNRANEAMTRFLQTEDPGSETWQSNASTAFFRSGLHGLVDWWIQHPEVPSAALAEIVMGLVWNGLAADSSSG